MQIEIFSDVVCPWCYLGRRRLERAVAESGATDVTLVPRAFVLDPSAPDDRTDDLVTTLGRRYGGRATALAMIARAEEAAAADGVPMRLVGARTGSTLRAHELVAYALDHGGPALADRVAGLLHEAYFTGGGDIFSVPGLVAVGTRAGLEPSAAAAALTGGSHRAAVAADLDRARLLGIGGVPFFVLDGRFGISGAQPVAAFRQALAQVRREQVVPVPHAGDPDAGDRDGCAQDSCRT